jgi:nucleotide-binding universal stress UspA family protein
MSYSKLLVPLDGSKVAEQVLPYARLLSRTLEVPAQLLTVIDLEELAPLTSRAEGRFLDKLMAEKMRESRTYLETIARSFSGAGARCSVERGKPEDVVIDRAGAERDTLIAMATHGRSGVQRWLLGSVAEKVLRGAANHLLLVRATEEARIDGEATLKTIVVPLDGSSLAEKALPYVAQLAKGLSLEVILMRAYALPPSAVSRDFGPHLQEFMKELETEARNYLAEKAEDLKGKGLARISAVVDFGYGAEEIIALGRKTPDNLIAMCTHGRSGIKRWVLGSVTEKVARHSGDPVLVVPAR